MAVDVLLHGMPSAPVPTVPLVPRESPWTSPERQEVRSEAAMGLMDADVCGFFLLTFHADDRRLGVADITTAHVIYQDWWPAVAEAVKLVRTDPRQV